MIKKILVIVLIISCMSGCSKENSETKLSADSQTDGLWEYEEIVDLPFESSLLSGNSYSISFWLKPRENKTGTSVLFLGDETEYISITSSGYSDGVYSGVTVESLHNGTSEWLVADGEKTFKSNRYNYFVLNVKKNHISLYLNGEEIVEGNVSTTLPNDSLYVGTNLIGLTQEEGFISNLKISSNLPEDEEIEEIYENKLGSVLLDTIHFPNAEDQQEDLWLVDYKIDGVDVHWTVDNDKVMNFQGKISQPSEDQTVILTATIATDKTSASKEFTLQILADSPKTFLQRDEKSLDVDVQGVMHEGETLPLEEMNGSKVEWKILEGNCTLTNGVLQKNTENEKEKIVLEATLSNDKESLTKQYSIVLLDKVEGYILSYFNGELEEETGYLAYSLDGLNWTYLQGSDIHSSLGTGRIRDPFITRDKEGNFVLLATEGFDNPSIYIMKSTDLIHFDEENLVHVAFYDAGLQMTGERAWAPEMTYDNENDLYYIYFSDNGFDGIDPESKGNIFTVTSSNLEEFSYPKSFFNPGYTVIDGTILESQGKYWMFYKDERKAAQTIFFSSTISLENGFDKAYDEEYLFNTKYMEGPFVVKKSDGTYYLYMDNYPKGTFYVGEFNSLQEDLKIHWLDESSYTLPDEDVRHGSVIGVTKNELNKIVEAYQ